MNTPLYQPTRPDIHFTAPSGWLNDPNGLVYYDGEYHLFYQHNPASIAWDDIHWGHAVSTDFVHWQHLPIGLYPDDIGMIWSGSAVVDDQNTSGLLLHGGLVAIFSYANQSQGIAYSSDKGRTWTKYAHNPVLANDGSKDFRDPKVFWYAPAQVWMMVVAVNTSVRFYSSPNLIDWTLASMFTDAAAPTDSVWECPDMLPLVTADGQIKWVLYFSLSEGGAAAGGSGTCYYIGTFDGTIFTADDGKRLWLDAGKDNYAGTTWSNLPDDRCIFIGWMTNQLYSGAIPATTWRGAMTLPRELSLQQTASGWRLFQRPLRELEKLRTTPLHHAAEVTVTGENRLELGGIGAAVEIDAHLQLTTAAEFELRINNQNEEVTIGISHEQQTMYVDRSATNGFDNADYQQRHSTPLIDMDAVHLQVFVDGGSVEVFVNDGEIVFSELLFMDAANRQISLYAMGGETLVKQLNLYALSSIYTAL